MKEQQVTHAMEVLARLYAEQYGIANPQITVKRKENAKDD